MTRYLSGKKAQYSNPKAIVNTELNAEGSSPQIKVTFLDNSKWNMDTTGLKYDDILTLMNIESDAVEMALEEKGVFIDHHDEDANQGGDGGKKDAKGGKKK